MVHIWQQKKTKKKFRVTEWWEILPDQEIINQSIAPEFVPERKWKMGMLVQCGWLFENEHGVWFGLSLKAKSHFKDLGPEKPKKRKRSTVTVTESKGE